MKNLSSVFVLAAMGAVVLGEMQPSSTSTVSLIGGVIKARHDAEEQDVKYPRKDCPVCEGKGWYMSGDGIEKVDCGYCEAPKQLPTLAPEPEEKIDEPALVPIIEKPKQFILR